MSQIIGRLGWHGTVSLLRPRCLSSSMSTIRTYAILRHHSQQQVLPALLLSGTGHQRQYSGRNRYTGFAINGGRRPDSKLGALYYAFLGGGLVLFTLTPL